MLGCTYPTSSATWLEIAEIGGDVPSQCRCLTPCREEGVSKSYRHTRQPASEACQQHQHIFATFVLLALHGLNLPHPLLRPPPVHASYPIPSPIPQFRPIPVLMNHGPHAPPPLASPSPAHWIQDCNLDRVDSTQPYSTTRLTLDSSPAGALKLPRHA